MAGKKLLDAALDRIRAYHGTPHKFDKFDMSKIGTGEGAQAYGHGLYFAENEGVARSYRDTLTQRAADGYSTPHFNAQQQVRRFGDDPERAAEVISGQMSSMSPDDYAFETASPHARKWTSF
jgi:hypothetical protein